MFIEVKGGQAPAMYASAAVAMEAAPSAAKRPAAGGRRIDSTSTLAQISASDWHVLSAALTPTRA